MDNNLITKIQLVAQPITSATFQPFGQVIWATENNKPYDGKDAQLSLEKGTPRLYIMGLHHRGRNFHVISRHSECTQCLGALGGKDWLIAVAPPCQESQPSVELIQAFHIPGNCFIKLEVGTWHAGPYFDHEYVDFYNLELADTNFADFFTHDFLDSNHLEFELVD
jgi:ureidoglycolate hydrolase